MCGLPHKYRLTCPITLHSDLEMIAHAFELNKGAGRELGISSRSCHRYTDNRGANRRIILYQSYT